MGYTDRFSELDERSRKQLVFKSRSLIGHYGFTGEDIEDIQQELYLHLYQQLPKYDPKRSSKATFVDRALTSASRDLIRKQTAQMRDYTKRKDSLDQPISSDNEGDITLGDSISDAQYTLATGRRMADSMRTIDLRIDVQRVLAKLDKNLRLICLGLAAQKTPTEISKELGICRQTFYDRRARIREAFEAAGMQVYAQA